MSIVSAFVLSIILGVYLYYIHSIKFTKKQYFFVFVIFSIIFHYIYNRIS